MSAGNRSGSDSFGTGKNKPAVTRRRIKELVMTPDLSCDEAKELEQLAEVVEKRATSQEHEAKQMRKEAEVLAEDAEGLKGLAEVAAEKAADRLEDCPDEE
jgi:hypothetical protein